MLSVTQETPDQEEVLNLLRKADERSSALYPSESRHGADIATLMGQGVRFFVARRNDIALGCGGYVPNGGGSGELKRMFVEAHARGQGIGRSILRAIEDEARREGIRVMRLETGVKSVEARGLYGRFGYRERGPFGGYGPDPLSVFMEKDLPARTAV
jgi:putative acetyltransferase